MNPKKSWLVLILLFVAIALLFVAGILQVVRFNYNEDKTIISMKVIKAAQQSYHNKMGSYASLEELVHTNLLNITGEKANGYVFRIIAKGNSYSLTAIPVRYGDSPYTGTGGLSFFLNETGVLRGGDKNGKEADVNDPPIVDD